MDLIREWSRLAGAAPRVANAVLAAPALSSLLKWLAGIAPQRRLPRYAPETFVQWFRRRRARPGGRRVMLWPDTFNNHFRPRTAIAATRLLEGLGYSVVIPDRPLCCGRPLYDWGMLDRARKRWRETLTVLGAEIRRGTPIIGLEPACVSAVRDELLALFPGETQAENLAKQTKFISEFIDEMCRDRPLRQTSGRALVQVHCHQHAVLDASAEQRVLKRTGLDYEIMKSGCCGMAGSFGFEREKYDVSMTAAERVLIPALRAAGEATIILANGFSCREQIEQAIGRPTLHVVDLLAPV